MSSPVVPPPAPLVRTRAGRRTLEFAPGDVQSDMLLSRPTALVLDYTRAMMGFVLFVPRPRHILMVGLGGGSLAKFCHRHFPDAHITVLEVRADVIALRDQFLVPPDGERFRVVHADAARFLAAPGGDGYDVLLVDGFDAAGLPPALADAAFYDDCRRALRPGGVLVVNVFAYDPRHGLILQALRHRFDGRLCWFEGAAGNNHVVYALGGGALAPQAARRQRWLARTRGFGFGWPNRIALRLLVAWIAGRSVRSAPHHPPDASEKQ